MIIPSSAIAIRGQINTATYFCHSFLRWPRVNYVKIDPSLCAFNLLIVLLFTVTIHIGAIVSTAPRDGLKLAKNYIRLPRQAGSTSEKNQPKIGSFKPLLN